MPPPIRDANKFVYEYNPHIGLVVTMLCVSRKIKPIYKFVGKPIIIATLQWLAASLEEIIEALAKEFDYERKEER